MALGFRIRLTSLLLVEERLLEAKYFARQLSRHRQSDTFRYQLNAFLAAARSVTFLLQKEMTNVPGFGEWWDGQRRLLASDPAAVFFLNLRNFSQKEGRVSLVGGSVGRKRWSYRFAGNTTRVPAVLLNRDVAECCHEHVRRLAKIVLAFADAFPHYSCPKRALTPPGVDALGFSLDDLDEVLGFPRGWTHVDDPAVRHHRLAILNESVDGVDFVALQRLANWKAQTGMSRRLLKFNGGSSDDYATWRSPSTLTRPS